jgi:hypothetical protein
MLSKAYNTLINEYEAGSAGFKEGFMKLVTLTLILISTKVFAAGFDMLQTEMARTVAQVNSIDAEIKTIKLNESGVLIVTKTDGSTKAIKLSDNNSEVLLDAAKNLSEVQPQTEIRTAVCEMMLSKLSEQKLSVIDTENNSMKLMLTSSSCANVSYTRPDDENALTAAKTLKTQMIVLARQLTTQN